MSDKRIVLERAVVKQATENKQTNSGKQVLNLKFSSWHKNDEMDQSGKKTVTEYYNVAYWPRGQNDFNVPKYMGLQPNMVVYNLVMRCEGHAKTSDKGYVSNRGTLESVTLPDVPIFEQPRQQQQAPPPQQGYPQQAPPPGYGVPQQGYAPPAQQPQSPPPQPGYAPVNPNQPYWATPQAPAPQQGYTQDKAMTYNQGQYQNLQAQPLQPVNVPPVSSNLYNDVE